MHGTHTLLAFFAIANADVLFARALLDGTDSGYYAAGLIVAKACLFLPQFVIVIVFPSLASSPGDTVRLRRAIVAVAGLGVVRGHRHARCCPTWWSRSSAARRSTRHSVRTPGCSRSPARRTPYCSWSCTPRSRSRRSAPRCVIWVGLVVLAVAAGIVLGAGIATGLTGVKVLVAMTSTCALLLSAVPGGRTPPPGQPT